MEIKTATKQPESNPIKRFLIKPTRSSAIKAKCAECMGCTIDKIEPGFRSSIRECSSFSCPLFQFRPYQLKVKSKNGELVDDELEEVEND